jgi:adenylate kinase
MQPNRSARVVLLGAPGSGKGTQGGAVAKRLGVPYISTGELLRARAAADDDIGHQLSAYLDRGDLVPDSLLFEVVGDALVAARDVGGYVLDGFPRSRAQAERLEGLAAPDAVVYLALRDDVARERLAQRSQAGRSDDVGTAAVARRLQLFHDETEPLVDFYDRRGRLATIDANNSRENVSAAIAQALAAHPPTAG